MWSQQREPGVFWTSVWAHNLNHYRAVFWTIIFSNSYGKPSMYHYWDNLRCKFGKISDLKYQKAEKHLCVYTGIYWKVRPPKYYENYMKTKMRIMRLSWQVPGTGTWYRKMRIICLVRASKFSLYTILGNVYLWKAATDSCTAHQKTVPTCPQTNWKVRSLCVKIINKFRGTAHLPSPAFEL